MGAGGAFVIGVLRGRLNRADIRRSLLQATRTAAAVFTVLIGALLVAGFGGSGFSTILGLIAVVFGTINVVGGFLVTERMLQMFRRRDE